MIRETATAREGPRRPQPDATSPLAVALGPPPGDRLPGSLVGLEHEYSLSLDGERLDFRNLIHALPIPGQRLDPGDVNAYRCASGLVITCDAEEAEVVTPPLPVRPGFAAEVTAWAEHGLSELVRALPQGVTVTPFSTHISASMPDDLVDAACDLFARTFAPALTLMFGGADSHGVFVRPRPGRLEVCGEHVMGAHLAAAAALVAGGARACATEQVPPLLAVDVRPARGRPGLLVGRHVAFGGDLYDGGLLPLQRGGTISAAEHLIAAWDAARTALGDHAGEADLRAGDAIVSGAVPAEGRGAGMVRPSPFGDLLRPRPRPGFEVVAVAATWGFTVVRLTSAARHAYACVPGALLGRFLQRLDEGALDVVLRSFLEAPSTGSVLAVHEETGAVGLWDDAVIGPELLPYEPPANDGDLVLPPPAKAAVVVAPLPPPALAGPAVEVVTSPPLVKRRRRRGLVLAGALLVLLLAAGAAAMSGLTGGGTPAVDIVTAPTALSASTTLAPSTTTETSVAPTTTQMATTTVPPAPTSTAPRPTTPVTVATTTVTTVLPVEATVQTTTTVISTTTTATTTQLVAAVTSGPLGCVFQPPAATVGQGSTVRFRNDTGGSITIVFPALGAATMIVLDAGGTSGALPLASAGSYAITCTPGGDAIMGRMTITVTAA